MISGSGPNVSFSFVSDQRVEALIFIQVQETTYTFFSS